MRLFKEPEHIQALVSNRDIIRINRARIAVRLQKFPSEVDAQDAQDIWDVMGILEDEAIRMQSKR